MTETFRLNGDPRRWTPGLLITGVLAAEGLEGRWFAVALDGAVVPSSRWEHTTVAPGSVVEIVRPCAGG